NGLSRLRKDHRRKTSRGSTLLGICRWRRFSSAGQHRKNVARHPAHRRRPPALAAIHSQCDGAMASSRKKRCHCVFCPETQLPRTAKHRSKRKKRPTGVLEKLL